MSAPLYYVARAIVSVDGQTAGTVSRPFRIVRAPKAMTSTPTSERSNRPTAADVRPGRVEDFDRITVLTQPVIGFFLDRLSATASNTAAFRPAMDDVRAGRFSEAMQSLDGRRDNELATAFLKGLVLLSKGDLDPAANKFRDALRIDSEFYPAAFYLGSCYAAGGRDREAAGAWQMSLIAEADAPFVYTMLPDALLRLREPAQAVDVLTEARSKGPDDEQIAARLAAAQALKKGSPRH